MYLYYMILFANKMHSTHADGNLSNNIKLEDEFDDCSDYKVSVNETPISEIYIKQDPCDTEHGGGDIYNYVNVKDKIIDDPQVIMGDTVLSEVYIKQDPYDLEDEGGDIYEYVNIKEEIIDDPRVIVCETGLLTNTKANYICCEECGEEYDLYCLNCPMLIRIFDSNNPNKDKSVRTTLPKNFIDICKTSPGVGIVALRVIPGGTVFGPFDGLDSTKDGTVSKWKLKDKELAYAKDPEQLNWMQYIRRADQSSHQNLTPFQYEGKLYYRSACHISVGDELLVYWDSNIRESGIQGVEVGYWKPQVCERLDDTYACTICCVGYRSICHLTAHNSRCPEKRNQNDFCKEITQCAFCKIYLDKKEYSEYHIDRCCVSSTKCALKTSHKSTLDYRIHYEDQKSIKCEHCDIKFEHTNLLVRHKKEVHAIVDETFKDLDPKFFTCPLCPYNTTNISNLRIHMTVHNDDKPFKCDMCAQMFNKKRSLARHERNIHSKTGKRKYKCPQCPFETKYNISFKRHVNAHNKSELFQCLKCDFNTHHKGTFSGHKKRHEETKKQDNKISKDQERAKSFTCSLCPYKTTKSSNLKLHITVHNDDKPFRCDMCPQMFKHKSSLTKHVLMIHSENEKIEYKCPKCPFETKYKTSFKHHVNAHNKSELFKCSKCDFNTHHRGTFNTHRNQHEQTKKRDNKIFKGSHRPNKTTKSPNLNLHITVHNEDKPFKCDTCPQMFKHKSSLMKHIRIMHAENERIEYKCPQCPFKTKYKTCLKHHVNAHNKSELFQCSKCDFNTHHKGTFNTHRNQHEQTEKQDKIFTGQERSKSISCLTCGTGFKFEGNLAAHIKRRHASKVKEEKSLIESNN